MSNRNFQLKASVAEYVSTRQKVVELHHKRQQIDDEITRERARSESRLDDLRQYVGRNLTSRCINLGAGETAILRYRGDDMKVLVEVYNDRGEPVPL